MRIEQRTKSCSLFDLSASLSTNKHGRAGRDGAIWWDRPEVDRRRRCAASFPRFSRIGPARDDAPAPAFSTQFAMPSKSRGLRTSTGW
jgi:hypothetical protein